MNILLEHINNESDTTIGQLRIDGEFECFTLEDEKRSQKIKGETRIPNGVYEIKKREVVSGLTQIYRDKYDWFDFHLEIQNVPDFNYVYIHVGNDDDHTDGCILLGNQLVSNRITENNNLLDSATAFKAMYLKVSEALLMGVVMIHIVK